MHTYGIALCLDIISEAIFLVKAIISPMNPSTDHCISALNFSLFVMCVDNEFHERDVPEAVIVGVYAVYATAVLQAAQSSAVVDRLQELAQQPRLGHVTIVMYLHVMCATCRGKRRKYMGKTANNPHIFAYIMQLTSKGKRRNVMGTIAYLSLRHKSKKLTIYHDSLPTPRRGSHVKSDKTHTKSSRYTP